MKVWLVLVLDPSDSEGAGCPVSVFDSEAAAKAEADRLNREARDHGHAVWNDPDNAEHDGGEWAVDYTVTGPWLVNEPANEGWHADTVPL